MKKIFIYILIIQTIQNINLTIGQENINQTIIKTVQLETFLRTDADIVQILPEDRYIQKYRIEGKTYLELIEKSGKRTKIYEGSPVDYFSHSQNGNRICFSTGGEGEFIVKDVNTLREFRYQTLDPIYLSSFATISPDGEKITFHKSKRLSNEGETINEGIIVVRNLSTKEDRVIGNGGWPKWSPNSTYIVFSRVEGSIGNWTSYLWIVNSDGSGLRKLKSSVSMNGGVVKWSYDGRRVMDSDREGNLRIVDVLNDETVVIPPSRFGKAPNNARKEHWNSSWSPAGKTVLADIITFNYRDEEVERELFLISVDGAKIEKLIIPGMDDEFPVWLNSNELLFRNTQQGNIWSKAIVRSTK